jgi:putative tryptophan/tyrosine transport system substrate-binding protein
MKRRELLSVLAGAAVWPVRVRAQQPAMPVIGFLHQGSADQNVERIATFRQGLMQAGFVEHKNVAIEFRWAEGKFERLPALAAELVQWQVAIFATPFSTDAALAAKAATTTIPIVFLTSADPVQVGLVPSLNRPGGNVTGVTTINNELGPKRLELLRDLVPNAVHYFALINPTSALAEKFTRDIEAAATRLGIHIEIAEASNEAELEAAFAGIPPQSLMVSSTDAFFFVQRHRIAALAVRYSVPSAFDAPAYTRAGGLLSYSGEDLNLLLLTTSYVGRILKGEQPADLPVAQPDKFVLTINLKTAKALGVRVPPTLLARADEVIE